MTTRLVALILPAIVLGALAAPVAARAQEDQGHGGGSGEFMVPPRVVINFAYELPEGGAPTALIVLWRGQPAWFRGAQRGEVSTARSSFESGALARPGGPSRVLTHDGEWSGIRLAFSYDPATDTALVAGQAVALRGANVVLVDRIDGVGGAPVVVGTASVDAAALRTLADPPRRGRGSREALREALERDERVRAFLQ
ncbi:MAG TPA: hypothetical protein VNA89_10110 [Gemmatimonadaceae bacterium]|nr:hypothetical protein [Gemmatimonadaceae bacterium]